MSLPTFLVIGTAKGGTTAMYWYLDEHPSVFMSQVKETNYFAYGVDSAGQLLYGDPDVHRFPIRTLPEYQNLFAGAGGAQAIGEASPLYLECPQAPGRIRSLLPSVQLVCMLRQPVERAYSDYLMYLRRRGRAFNAEQELTSAAAWARPDSRWMQVSRYGEQLARYYDAFPREQLLVTLFDDLKRDATEVVQAVYRFVGVDPSFRPDFGTPHAAGGVPANRWLEGLLSSRAVLSAVRPLLPTRAANWVRRVRQRNLRKAPPLPLPLRAELTAHFREDIQRTSDLIGRSLDHWL